MKKTLIGLALLSTIGSASALDFGVGYSRDISNDVNGVGISVGESWKNFSLTASAERFDVAGGNHDQVSLIGGYQLIKVAGVAIEGQFGASYITSDVAKDGLIGVVGLGASMPLYRNISVTSNVRRNIGSGDMKVHDGTTAGLGLKYSF